MDVIVFGTGQLSTLAWHQFHQEGIHRVAAFTVDTPWIDGDNYNGLPLVPFEGLAGLYPPDRFAMFVPLSYRNLSRLRVEKYEAARAMGYGFLSIVPPAVRADPSVEVGEGCFIDPAAIILPFARIGANCRVSAGAIISHDVTVERHCFISAAAVIGGGASIGERCVLALNSTVLNGLRVAPRCLVGAGAVLTADTTEGGVYLGVPARRRVTPAPC